MVTNFILLNLLYYWVELLPNQKGQTVSQDISFSKWGNVNLYSTLILVSEGHKDKSFRKWGLLKTAVVHVESTRSECSLNIVLTIQSSSKFLLNYKPTLKPLHCYDYDLQEPTMLVDPWHWQWLWSRSVDIHQRYKTSGRGQHSATTARITA